MHSLASTPAPRQAFVLALGLLLLAAVLQWTLRPVFGTASPFIFFYPAVGVAAMRLGWRPGLVVLLGGLVSGLLWLPPPGTFWVTGAANRLALGLYLAGGGLLLALGEQLNQLRMRATEAEQRLAMQVHDLQALHDLGGRLMLLADLHSQLKAILETLRELKAAHSGLISLRERDADVLHTVACVGFSPQGQREVEALPAGQGPWGCAVAEQMPVTVEDLEADPQFPQLRELARREGFRAVHCRPLPSFAGEVFGVLSVQFSDARAPSARDNQLCNLCAQMAAVLVERARMRRETQAALRKVDVALQSSAVPFNILKPITDSRGDVVDFSWDYLNAAAARTLGRDVGQLLGRPVTQLQPRAWDPPDLLDKMRGALQQPVEFEYRPDARWFRIVASPCETGVAVWWEDVTERKLQEQALREADRRKDEFLATLAHELRNPLAPIRQAAMIARSTAATPAQQRWSLEVIDRQVAHMAVLLDDLLDVSRITRGKLELRREVTDLRAVAESALEAARPLAEARRQQLKLEWPDTPLWADVDPMRIAQIVSNLLTNASKYTQFEGEIRLAARRDGPHAVIEVKDNGIGIPPESLEEVFEMFTQVRTSPAAASMGLGIGLALSRGLAQMHGATLTAHSEGLGCGSTFALRLDVCEAPAGRAAADVPLEHSIHPHRVLVADDNRDAAESLAEVLRMEGHEVTLAFDGETALQEFRRVAPEIALLDIGMPRMSGNEVARAIRSSPAGESTVLVAITGWGQQRDRAAAKDAGFDFHFTKPVDPAKVLRLIEETVKGKEEAVGH
jgi:signal transduction histidine kinase/ActR/RegA family two-component response regulator